MWISDELQRKTEWIASFGDIKDIEFIKIFPEEMVARFKITYWDAQDDSDYGRSGGLVYEFVDFPYDLDWGSDDEGDYCLVEEVGLSNLEGVLSQQQVDYIWTEIESAVC